MFRRNGTAPSCSPFGAKGQKRIFSSSGLVSPMGMGPFTHRLHVLLSSDRRMSETGDSGRKGVHWATGGSAKGEGGKVDIDQRGIKERKRVPYRVW